MIFHRFSDTTTVHPLVAMAVVCAGLALGVAIAWGIIILSLGVR